MARLMNLCRTRFKTTKSIFGKIGTRSRVNSIGLDLREYVPEAASRTSS